MRWLIPFLGQRRGACSRDTCKQDGRQAARRPEPKQKRTGGSQKQKQVGDNKQSTSRAVVAPGRLQGKTLERSHTRLPNGDAIQPDYETTVGEQETKVRTTEPPLQAGDVGEPPLRQGLGPALSNGGSNERSPAKRKPSEERGFVLDKRLRYSIRHPEGSGRFQDIVVRKEDGFTHILLSSQTSDNNALTPKIMKEVTRALGNAAADDSKLLLLSAVGNVFCSGLDHSYLIGRLTTDRRKESIRIAESIRDFVKAFIQFKKPIVAAVNGPALGLGVSILPLCDIVWASEKAWFQTPYATFCLTPTGCSSYTFPQVLGVALANDLLFCGRKLTAQEACSRGLVSQVFWPNTFSQELMLRVKEMATANAVVLEESKLLVRSFLSSVLEEVNEKECQMLKQLWSTTKGLDSLFAYLQDKVCHL
ncbi:chromodomain Y-like protein 2 [Arapaima gigas]